MKFPKAVLVGAAAAALVSGGVFGVIHAAHAQDDCGVTSADIAKIAAVESDPSLSSSAEISKELSLRRQLVGRTITCAENEAQEFQVALADASTTDTAGMSVQSQLMGSLSGAYNFYDLELQKLNTAGIAGTEEIAQEVLAWRAGTFVPLSENVSNFILWSENQDLFDTAQTRMNETQSAVSFIESNAPNAALQSAFDQAVASFNDSEDQNAAARSALEDQISPDQSLALIKQSLGSLSETYQDFSAVSTLIKGALPQ